MTRDEALIKAKNVLNEATAYEDAVCYVTVDDREWLDMAIKALGGKWIVEIEKCPLVESEGSMTLVYIVIDSRIEDGIDCGYYIDSVWTSERKAQKRCDKLNRELEEEPIQGVGLYQVVYRFIRT